MKQGCVWVLLGMAAGCGSESSGDTIMLDGYAYKGIIVDASVEIRDAASDELLADTTTDNLGRFSAEIPAERDIVAIVRNGNFHHESDRTMRPLTGIIRCFTTAASSDRPITVSPLTEAAYKRAIVALREGASIRDAIDGSHQLAAEAFGVSGVEIDRDAPDDLATTDDDHAGHNVESLVYGARLAALAELADARSVDVLDLMDHFSADLADGVLDGANSVEGGDPTDERLTDAHNDLGTAEDTFLNSEDNTSGTTTQERDAAHTDVESGAGDEPPPDGSTTGDGTTTGGNTDPAGGTATP